MNKLQVYTDGGVWMKNPSPDGGAWAIRVVVDGEVVHSDSGVVAPDKIGTLAVSNNNTELKAVIKAVGFIREQVRSGSVFDRIEVLSDSKLALGWMFEKFSVKNVPSRLSIPLEDIRGSLHPLHGDDPQFGNGVWDALLERPIYYALLAGHPTKADLAVGYKDKGSGRYPVSEHNAWCDRECGRIMSEAFGSA